MEKYGVDKENDKIEKKAEDLVKTGAAKSIDAAREQAVKEEVETNGTAEPINANS
jgi:hypothetical protein